MQEPGHHAENFQRVRFRVERRKGRIHRLKGKAGTQLQHLNRKLSIDSGDSEWQFVVLENGGGFMQPEGDMWHFCNPDSGAEVTLSAEATGIVITAMVLNHRSWFYDRHDEPDLCEHFCERFRQLAGYISTHDEYDAIYRALN